MLPILRIIPVGGVLLAIMLLVLALNPPQRLHAPMQPGTLAARGALIDRSQHPEWRQFLNQAAIRRAAELNRLRELPDAPARTDTPPPASTAGLPSEASDSDPDPAATGSIAQQPAANLPLDIGEASAFELPVAAPKEETPPAVRPPQEAKPPAARRVKRKLPPRRAKTAKPQQNTANDFFGLLGTQNRQPPSAASR